MYGFNPNSRNPFVPKDLSKTPLGTGNLHHYGFERIAGQVAVQPNRYGFGGGTNSVPKIKLPARPTARRRYV